MNIAVIRPSMFGEPASDRMMPLLFAILGPLTPLGVELHYYDERTKSLPDSFEESVAAITVETFAARRAYQLADKLRGAGITVIMGGFHPTMLPDEAAEHADAVLLGDAEDTWPKAVADLQAGCLQGRYVSRRDTDLSALVYDYRAFRGLRYLPVGMVQFGRGCKFSCDFCSIHAFYGGSVRMRPLQNIIEDIRKLRQPYLFFIDDNLFSDEDSAIELFKALIPLRKKWVCQISMDAARRPELLRLMRQSGCRMVIIGFESLDPENLRQMGKGVNHGAADYETVIRNIYDAGMMIYGTFVIGYDADTPATAESLMRFALRHKFAIANFNPLMPMPGTPLYERLKAAGRLTCDRWWVNEDYRYGDAMFTPKGMTGQELTESCKAARYRFNAPHNLLWRTTNLKANSRTPVSLLLFIAAGLISRREIHFKQGRRLGCDCENHAD